MEEIEKIGKESNFDSLRHVAATSLNSKMLNPHSSFFVDLLSKYFSFFPVILIDSNIIINRVLKIVPKLEMNKIRIEKITGADLRVSEVMEGIIFEPTFSYAGADQLSKSLLHPKILFLDHEVLLIINNFIDIIGILLLYFFVIFINNYCVDWT